MWPISSSGASTFPFHTRRIVSSSSDEFVERFGLCCRSAKCTASMNSLSALRSFNSVTTAASPRALSRRMSARQLRSSLRVVMPDSATRRVASASRTTNSVSAEDRRGCALIKRKSTCCLRRSRCSSIRLSRRTRRAVLLLDLAHSGLPCHADDLLSTVKSANSMGLRVSDCGQRHRPVAQLLHFCRDRGDQVVDKSILRARGKDECARPIDAVGLIEPSDKPE